MQKENFYALLENQDTLNPGTLPEFKKLTEEYPYFQTARLLYLKNLKITGHPEFDSELKKSAPLIADRKQLYRLLHPETATSSGKIMFEQQTGLPTEYLLENAKGNAPGNNLIDKFLSSKPETITMKKTTREDLPESSDNDIAAKSVSESDELITETLAMIYFEQKNYDKALDAFQKLRLKYPEKSVYFASRIEEIEKLKNI